MANYHRNNVGSLVLGHHRTKSSADTVNSNFCLWNSLSTASFRRILFDALSYGGATYRCNNHTNSASSSERSKSDSEDANPNPKRNAKSEKLSDLLSMADSEVETEAETKKKEEALDELKRLVEELRLPSEDSPPVRRVAAASAARRLATEDAEVRVTLAMLGAISPLAAMLDSEDIDSQVASLYALLNLGIGNDA